MKKRIGIPGWIMDNSFGVGISYLEFIYKFGVPVIITPIDSDQPPEVDMVLCPGGSDLLPSSYGAMPGFRTQKPNIALEHFDDKILPKYIENKTPIFAICRGMQRIWAIYGGRIEQNNTWHEQSAKYPQEQVHELHFSQPFFQYSKMIGKVTSRHHQCADASYGVPDELEVIAYAKAENNKYYAQIVEIFKHKTLPIFGVQFHPEDHDATDRLSTTIIKEFLNIA